VYDWSFTKKVHEHLFEKIGKNIDIVVPTGRGENLGVIINV
jgi:hypothetical protein